MASRVSSPTLTATAWLSQRGPTVPSPALKPAPTRLSARTRKLMSSVIGGVVISTRLPLRTVAAAASAAVLYLSGWPSGPRNS